MSVDQKTSDRLFSASPSASMPALVAKKRKLAPRAADGAGRPAHLGPAEPCGALSAPRKQRNLASG